MSPESAYPLIDYPDLGQVMVYRPHARVTAGAFLAEAQRLAERIGDVPHVVNLCQDRYHFMLGLAAAILAGKISLLPSTHTDETLRQLFERFPAMVCLQDRSDWSHPYPTLMYPEPGAATAPPPDVTQRARVPLIDGAQPVAYVFTSGSTGQPVPHVKTWGKLVRNARAAVAELGLDQQTFSLVGTVPPQHMFGFESTVLLCLQGRCPLWSGRPFYPADLVAALAAVPRPRMLVTTPFHLESLLSSGLSVPPVAQLLLATAPLSLALATEAERSLAAPLREIYGCTETGQIATRRPTESVAWTLFPGIVLEPEDARTGDGQTRDGQTRDNQGAEGLHVARGGHIERPITLSDRLDVQPDGRFFLLGRVADQVNIAGKRSALSFLTAQLKAIPGVQDGVFFEPEDRDEQAIPRLCALVVAPSLTAREIIFALRTRLDPAFLPRPLIRVDALPYNETGKLPRLRLQSVLDAHLERLKL